MLRQTLAAATILFSAQTMAAPMQYEFSSDQITTGGAGDFVNSISTTWDATNEILTWNTDFTTTDVDSFWLVVNDGPNPKTTDTNELVIMYGDLDLGIVTTYVYNGANNANSYNTPGIFLQRDDLNVTGTSIDFTIDATDMNARTGLGIDYRGLLAGPDEIGVWFHMATGSDFVYNGEQIVDYDFATQGWFDSNRLDMNPVPESGALALMGIGLVSVMVRRRRRQA